MVRIEIHKAGDKGQGIFALRQIIKGEVIFDWEINGFIYKAPKASDLPGNLKDYAIQFERDSWIDTNDFGRYSNHSCTPNAGIQGLFKLVALRDIAKDEEIVWDYDTTENSDWVMENCKCGSNRCRGTIRGYRYLPEDLKKEYLNITSDWIKMDIKQTSE